VYPSKQRKGFCDAGFLDLMFGLILKSLQRQFSCLSQIFVSIFSISICPLCTQLSTWKTVKCKTFLRLLKAFTSTYSYQTIEVQQYVVTIFLYVMLNTSFAHPWTRYVYIFRMQPMK
jgi:hypothetical protein